MKKFRKGYVKLLCLVLIYVIFLMFYYFSGSSFFSGPNDNLEKDYNMQTEYFNTDVVVREDQSYEVREHIGVNFSVGRQGIYRHIPYKGTVGAYNRNGREIQVPYYAKITGAKSNEPLSTGKQNGSWVGRMGTEGEYKYGGEYQLSYTFTPQLQSESYNNAYYNLFPAQWQNDIPAGSRFTVAFPKDFDHNLLRFYYGKWGEARDGADILKLSWENNTVTGVLEQDLPMGSGVTFYAPMEEGYFTGGTI